MKRLKLILATLVAVFSAFAGSTAFAADSYTITVNNPVEGHTYEAYQIFTGSLGADGQLGNIEWGVNVDGTKFGNASDFAKVLEAQSANAENVKKIARDLADSLKGEPVGTGTSTITGLTAGYYLIKDKDGAKESITEYILQVVKDTEITPKVGTPTVVKKVKDTNDTTGETSDWQDSADHDINDKVPFQLTATLPENFDAYDTYYLNFVDELSKGLKYNEDAEVFLVNGDTRTPITDRFTIAKDGSSFSIEDLKKVAGVTKDSKIVVEYTATLTEDAVLGSAGNPNTVKLVYSNNPNYNGDGSDRPTGETPKDTVIVFTYKVVVDKVDQDTKPLAGAEFTLSKKMKDGTEKKIAVVKNDAGDQFSFSGLDDGEYVLKETKTPAGYNTIDEITFKVVASHDTDSEDPKLTDLNGEKVTGEIKFTSNLSEGSLTTQVKNQKGSKLPSTGSTGTTLLYVLGSILVVGAGVLLVTKKRMESK